LIFRGAKGLLFTAVFLFTLGGSAQGGDPADPCEPESRGAAGRTWSGNPAEIREAPRPVSASRRLSAERRLHPSADSFYVIEAGVASFGDLIPGSDKYLPAAVRVRVFSERDWVLKLLPASPLLILDRGESVPLSRLAWRSASSGGFLPFDEGSPATIAQGSATGGAGQLVLIDFRMRLDPRDAIGRYGCDFRLRLETL